MTSARLPPPWDPRWRSAPLASGEREVPFLPLAPPHVPRLSKRVAWLREGARLILLEDGYPARLTKLGVVVHPMHGRYLLDDLLRQHEAKPAARTLDAIRRTVSAVIGRAELRGSSLLMWYEGGNASGLVGGRRHISGLPQAYYAALLARVAAITGNVGTGAAADQFFEPLLTPMREGGVLYEGAPGPSLAMVPMAPRDWILNGWLSMLVSADQFAAERSSADARELVRANIGTLIEVLPAFDAPAQRLSRYMLPGMLTLRLSFSAAVESVALHDLRISIPDEPTDVPIPLRDASGWEPRIVRADVAAGRDPREVVPMFRGLRMVALLSRAPLPKPNVLRFRVSTPRPMEITVTAFIGSYAPLKSSTVHRQWAPLGTVDVEGGEHDVAVSLPYEPIDLFSYPTNFVRRFGGRQLNTYHGTHIVRLDQLAERTGSRTLRTWAERWRSYVDEWPGMPEYNGLGCWTPEGDIQSGAATG